MTNYLLDLSIINNWFMYLENLMLLIYVLPVRQLEILSQWLYINSQNNYSLFYTDKDYNDMKRYHKLTSNNNHVAYIDKYNFDPSRHYVLNDTRDLTYYLCVNYPLLYQSQAQVYILIKELNKINNRKKRCKIKIENLIYNSLNKGCVPTLATFTINDEHYNKPLKYYLLKLKRLLKKHFDNYIINVDYGLLHDRLHFHCLLSDRINNVGLWSKDLKYWGLGCVNVKKIRIKSDITCVKKINNYINKLSNHACKDSTRQTKIIYSRDL